MEAKRLVRFEDPIRLHGGGYIVTLQDAYRYLEKLNLSETDQRSSRWRSAIKLLEKVAARPHRAYLILARMTLQQAILAEQAKRVRRPEWETG